MSNRDELNLGYSETNSVCRYVPINQFPPLSDNNWMTLGKVQSGEIDPENLWQFWLTVTAFNRSTKATSGTFKVGVQNVRRI